jgi:glycosyltransferase involved in cell wall biosynthesis
MNLSVIIPCLNEAETLEICLHKALKKIKELNLEAEIIVADNGSTDGSIELANKNNVVVVNVPKKGYGNAIDTGIKKAKGKYVLVADADDSYDFEELPKFYNKIIENYDIVQGCRFPSGGGKINPGAMPISHKFIGNPFFTKLAKIFYGVPYNDIYCGMKIFKREFYDKLSFFSSGMVYNIEVLLKFYIAGARISEIPITLHKDGRKKARSHLKTIPDGLKTLKFLLVCSPNWLYFLPGVLLLIFTIFNISSQIINKTEIISEKEILNNFIYLSLSIQIIMLGLFSTIISEKIGFKKKNSLLKFFKIFDLRLALGLSLSSIVILLFTKINEFEILSSNINDLFVNFGIFISLLVLINSFFVSLLTIDK